ncbi:myocyte-specific enhancer factor 2 isoform X4 [Episyrphus balteatus]|uniref:myocyte-specific enhancer factor 2 isoform X4 n=1 Tax=Episyrphus balteatus TaxID=286459 RepID=UPI002485A4A8|nr:myocyte-specific enhancer factor 2 isoform X4 [Episyrphus balteatus]
MGRKKIQISRITDERNRQVTFNKRKFGVMKKAYELSVLCDCEIALIIFSSSNKLYQYASTDMDKVLLKYTEYNEPHESLTNKNIIEKENKNGVMSPDSPEQETDYTLTPRTEAKYNKIEEDFQMVMQRTQMTGGARNMTNPNYTLPVSMPVGDSYGGAMLQASPQMSHTNISPRPSSSETDSGGMSLIIYPSASMLEMSNGYPHSHSPLGGSPSPGPSPGIGGQNNNKSSHHISHKQQSPGGQNGRASNLRVVIPTPTIAPNMSNQDDIGYSDVSSQSQSQSQQQFQSDTLKNTFLIHHQQRHNQTSLNTPVVTLQTPIPALTSYSFPQDFSMSSSDVMSLSSWTTHQGLVQHTSLPHLAVSNSTPPPATSPISIKVKSEPVSPPRDLSSGQGGHSSSQHQQHQQQQQQQHQQHSSSHLGQSPSGAISITTMNTAAVIAGGGGGGGGGGGSNSNSSGGHNSSATNLSVLSHPQQHLVMSTSRPSSTGHLTPTPVLDKYDGYCRSQLGPSSRFWNFAGSVTPTNAPSPDLRMSSQLSDYDSPNQPHKRPRISEGWST